MSESLTGPQWVWMMKTSQPRIELSYRQWISPLANSRRFASPSCTPRWAAICSARAGCDRPETSSRRRRGISSTQGRYRVEGRGALEVLPRARPPGALAVLRSSGRPAR